MLPPTDADDWLRLRRPRGVIERLGWRRSFHHCPLLGVDRIPEGRATLQSPGSASDGIRDHRQSRRRRAWLTAPANVLVRADEVICESGRTIKPERVVREP